MSDEKPRLLLIDDDDGQLDQLRGSIAERLANEPVTIDVWRPSFDDDVRERLIKELAPRPTLVVTDHDLTANGAAGLFGGTVISWCRANAIPVGDYSRKLSEDLEEPDMFEFRFDSSATKAAEQIADLFLGFRQLDTLLAGQVEGGADSWSQSLAAAPEREFLLALLSPRRLVSRRSHRSPRAVGRGGRRP